MAPFDELNGIKKTVMFYLWLTHTSKKYKNLDFFFNIPTDINLIFIPVKR